MEREPYDYIDTVLPDKDVILTLEACGGEIKEICTKRDSIKKSVDGKSETRLNFSGITAEWYLFLAYNNMTESNIGTLTDYFNNENYGNGRINSFKYTHSDTHTYIVRFESFFERTWRGVLYSWPVCVFRILGKA